MHDPPSKPFNLKEHQEIADDLIRQAGFDDIENAKKFFEKECDFIAASADRLIFPKPTVLKEKFQREFIHTLGSTKLQLQVPDSASQAEDIIKSSQPVSYNYDTLSNEEEKDKAKFFIHWRLWRKFVAEKNGYLLFLPADTRIPNHTIWTHCAITSALQGCIVIEQQKDHQLKFEPSFLIFQIGPVQEFIAQARKTKDLWSGSYLLSWLIAHGIKAVSDQRGPDAIIYPTLFGQPLFDYLHKDFYEKIKTADGSSSLWTKEFAHLDQNKNLILTPNLPNRFLALVPYSEAANIAQRCEKAIKEELDKISQKCVEFLKEELHKISKKCVEFLKIDENIQNLWNLQIDSFIQISWVAHRWEMDVEKALTFFEQLPYLADQKDNQSSAQNPAKNLRTLYNVARNLPPDDLDPRNYIMDAQGKPTIKSSGFCWSAHYAITDWLHAGRRNTRDFSFYGSLNQLHQRRGIPKDMYSGKEECIGGEAWQNELHQRFPYLFKENERLGALNILKRIWDEAYLEKCHKLSHEGFDFDSVPDVAAYCWYRENEEKLKTNDKHKNFLKKVNEAKEKKQIASLYFQTEIKRRITEYETEKKSEATELKEALNNLIDLQKELQSEPVPYVAILAMDGDSMGKKLSGADAPKVSEHLSEKSKEYFSNHARDILGCSRPLFPSYHIELSQALANFSLYLAALIVEKFYGQLIYAGGDDILAMLPAEKALDCACLLRKAFRGDPSLANDVDNWFKGTGQTGFLILNNQCKEWENLGIKTDYPLILMGERADISAGIAIGHIHSPLQNLVEEARRAEKKAKTEPYNKGSFVVSLFKRSGEILQWGSKWELFSQSQGQSSYIALELFKSLNEYFNKKYISARFPYRLAELTQAYFPSFPHKDSLDGPEEVKKVIEKDFDFAIEQHFNNNASEGS
ncbi:type III-B CRISPR-associated protein Cas10/Cmr2 [Methylacidiphilum caldifontis]|uniref:Type III-B CRISPR-associated protein Cas10/Cmr2 n=1 Tax=Methylacidiphilum caldifontis TaxID=2795386 RepID=A0A4Y8P9J4_9BACT|nr:type III-B CRISPR-associated protein Cas10/Cmr2 [Methylacidiphilum caldifontis]